jgi:hypothetical protein
MKIKNLPSVIKKRAKINIKKEWSCEYKPKTIMNAFDWSDTIEGLDYWILVYEGKFLDAENHLREKNGDDLKEELFEVEKNSPLISKIIEQLSNSEEITEEKIKWSEEGRDRSKPFFLDEALDIKVNEPEVVSYKDEYVKIDPIVNSVIDKFLHRSRVGIEKYGTTLERNDLSLDEWINHAQEEAMDLCLYLTKIKEDLKKK